jgi:hypothetical protein
VRVARVMGKRKRRRKRRKKRRRILYPEKPLS